MTITIVPPSSRESPEPTKFETTAPAPYFTRPAHIHIRVQAAGFQVLVTQHYLQKKPQGAVFDLVLVPEL